MFKPSLLDTLYAKQSGMEGSTNKVMRFLLENKIMTLSQDVMDDIFASRVRTVTPVSTIFEHISKTSARNIFTGFYPNIGRNNISIPDLLTLSSITIDLKNMGLKDVVKNIREYEDKIIINVKGLIRYAGPGDKPFITDSHELYSLFVRGALCRSYSDLEYGKGWFSPSLARFIIQSYSAILANLISRTYGLGIEVMKVEAILALYFAKCLWNGGELIPPTFYLIAGSSSTFKQRFDKKYLTDLIEEYKSSITYKFTLDNACELIAMIGPERLRSFTSRNLAQLASNLGSDNISNMISLEYPPYWTHQILLAISGGKSTILYQLKQTGLIEQAKLFAKDLNISPTFISELEEHI